MKLSIVFYHPKNPLNLHDMLLVAKGVSAKLLVVQRPGHGVWRGVEEVEAYSGLREAVDAAGCGSVLVLETYGDVLVSEAAARLCNRDCVTIIAGAEDYGVPRWEVEGLAAAGYDVTVAVIPSGITGMSYNVVSAVVMALYELRRSCSGRRRGSGVGEPEF